MEKVIYTTEGIIQSLQYLEGELKKHRLDKETAVIYLHIIVKSSQNDKIVRPTFTYSLPEFDNYIRFFKRYNLIMALMDANTYSFTDELWGNLKEFHLSNQTNIEVLEVFPDVF